MNNHNTKIIPCFKIRHLIILIFYLIIVWCSSLSAQEREITELTASETKTLIEQVEKRFHQTSSLGSCFEQEKHMSLFEETVLSKGLLFFQTPEKVRMDLFDPVNTSIVMNNGVIAEYEYLDNGWLRLPPEKNRMSAKVMDNIIAWLQGKFSENSVYAISGFKEDSKFGDGSGFRDGSRPMENSELNQEPHLILRLTPRDENFKKHIQYFELGIKNDLTGLDHFLIMQPDSDFTRYNFYNDQLNGLLPDNIFNTDDSMPFPVSDWKKSCRRSN